VFCFRRFTQTDYGKKEAWGGIRFLQRLIATLTKPNKSSKRQDHTRGSNQF
jgi:hypothetical protein